MPNSLCKLTLDYRITLYALSQKGRPHCLYTMKRCWNPHCLISERVVSAFLIKSSPNYADSKSRLTRRELYKWNCGNHLHKILLRVCIHIIRAKFSGDEIITSFRRGNSGEHNFPKSALSCLLGLYPAVEILGAIGRGSSLLGLTLPIKTSVSHQTCQDRSILSSRSSWALVSLGGSSLLRPKSAAITSRPKTLY